ncbi:MAG TPA: helicase-exonuclease AddAB subunit AddA [Clostridia bacterium]|nr:helicase-exonuclease AddAB subunit AddA [Clostridia bacterium]
MKWTYDQQNAIDSRQGTVLVSAAAGSGKTAVLVERIIRRLKDKENSCGADRLLVVTFTKAATAQMREKIGAAISKELAKTPDDKHLLRQQMLFPFAQICTIDSFCNKLVRENFQSLDISPDYRTLDNNELELIKQEAVSNVIEKLYQEESPEFTQLVELMLTGSNDKELINAILKLHNFSTAYSFPNEWLNGVENFFDKAEKNDIRVKLLTDYYKDLLSFCISSAETVLKHLEEKDSVLYYSYLNTFNQDIDGFKELLETAQGGDWDSIMESALNYKFCRINRAPKDHSSNYIDFVKIRRNGYKDIFNKTIKKMFCSFWVDFEDDIEHFRPVIKKLFEALRLFEEELMCVKKQSNAYAFSDISHFALKLLVRKNNDGKIEKTELAKSISDNFTEILIDEFQDINETQDMLFYAVSKDRSNIFMVGDVKQSIYRFRNAMPEIFLSRRNSMNKFSGNNYPASIFLNKNFRSREGVLDAVNFVFAQIMSFEVGEVDYNDDEKLVYGADYSLNNEVDAQLHLLEYNKNESKVSKGTEQAAYVAQLIEQMVSDGYRVKDKHGERPCEYRDFCILMRTKKMFQILANELESRKIPVHTELANNFISTNEVSFVLSLLKILDNPIQDIPLMTVMLSPIYGFTPDDLAQFRIDEKSGTIYDTIINAKNNGNKKCIEFLDELNRLRMYFGTCSPANLIQMLLEETGYLAIAGAMSNGEQGVANLRLLIDYAETYGNYGNSISGFLRFIDRLSEQDLSSTSSTLISESSNVVRIITIHKSKGLEFPICFLINCEKKFNLMDLRKNYVMHSDFGIGLKRRNDKTMQQFNTLAHVAVSLAMEKSQKSEEMRVLYVALTRAKERIIMVMSEDNIERKLESLSSNLLLTDRIEPFAVLNSNSYSDWLLTASLLHPDSHLLRDKAKIDSSFHIKSDSKLEVFVEKPGYKIINNQDLLDEKSEPDMNLLKAIDEKLSFEYKNLALSEVVAKRAASELKESGINRQFFAALKPAFMNEKGLTPAQKGTATHKFMQFSDYKAAKFDLESEIKRLVEMGYLSKQEGSAVDLKKVHAFFESTLANRIFNSPNVMREKKFTINVSVSELYKHLEDFKDEYVLVQGIADCVFVEDNKLVIVDYKTDYVTQADELKKRYNEQLFIYKKALSQCLDLPVKQTLIYSFSLGAEIEIN